MSTEHFAMRVNSAKLPEYVGKNVRLWCKCLKFDGNNSAVVEATDGGHIKVTWSGEPNLTDTYAEIIGTVMDSTTIKMMACINLGSELDLKLADETVELMHDRRFHAKLFGSGSEYVPLPK